MNYLEFFDVNIFISLQITPDKIEGQLYSPQDIAERLGLSDASQLPYLAALVGNDYLDANALKSFHDRIGVLAYFDKIPATAMYLRQVFSSQKSGFILTRYADKMALWKRRTSSIKNLQKCRIICTKFSR
jgi:hypothetical protein